MAFLHTHPRLSATMLACSLLLFIPSSDIEQQEPPDFPLVSQISAMDGGYGHTCAVTTGGKVICWGDNSSGQLGIGTFEQRLVPVEVTTVSEPVTTVATGSAHTCVLTASGRVKCWGSSMQGQLGTGKVAWKTAGPVDVEGLGEPMAVVAAGDRSTCALSSAGGVKCWGSNLFGQLGDGTTAYRSLPVVVPNLESDVEMTAAGFTHTCTVLDNNQVSCWEWNFSGQLGRGVKSTDQKPFSVIGLEGKVSAMAAMAAVPASPPAQTPRECCLPRPSWRILSRSGGTDGEQGQALEGPVPRQLKIGA